MEQEFLKLIYDNQGIIHRVARMYRATREDQEDLFQEITLQVWRSIPGFRHESAVVTWIYRIALNTAITWISREKKYRNANDTTDNLPDVLLQHNIQADERLDWLYKTIHQLNEIDRSIILLLLDGFSYKEMATILGISETNVGVKINRIKKQLAVQSKKLYENGI